MNASDQLAGLGGIARRDILLRHGVTRRALAEAHQSGSIRRIRRGWYTTLPAADPRVVACRIGGVLSGASALKIHGSWLWNPPDRIDVVIPRGKTLMATPPSGVRVTFLTDAPAGGCSSVTDALLHAIPRLPFEEAVAVLDWACHTGRLDEVDLHRLFARLPTRLRRIAAWVDPDCESVLESIVRTRLRLLGYEVVSQVPVDTVRSIDLVVDGVLGLELDGRAYHESSFDSDREKDLAIVLEGRAAMRVSYGMVRRDWPRVERGIAAAVAMHRGHRRASGMRRPRQRLQTP